MNFKNQRYKCIAILSLVSTLKCSSKDNGSIDVKCFFLCLIFSLLFGGVSLRCNKELQQAVLEFYMPSVREARIQQQTLLRDLEASCYDSLFLSLARRRGGNFHYKAVASSSRLTAPFATLREKFLARKTNRKYAHRLAAWVFATSWGTSRPSLILLRLTLLIRPHTNAAAKVAKAAVLSRDRN